MCIVFFTLNHPTYKLILASNRDEFFDRPALPAAWHSFDTPSHLQQGDSLDLASPSGSPAWTPPWILSGRDLGSPQHGTWLGMTSDLRIGVITNIRVASDPTPRLTPPPSRGLLLKSFLAPRPSKELPGVQDYLADLYDTAEQYEGFNLLLFHLFPPSSSSGAWGASQIGCLSNKPGPILTDSHLLSRLDQNGLRVKGLSNSPLAEPWPKVTQGERAMKQSLVEWAEAGEDEAQMCERMFKLLRTSIPIESETNMASCTCIPPLLRDSDYTTSQAASNTLRWYGTRLSTVILVRHDGQVTFVERDIGGLDKQDGVRESGDERRFNFSAQMN